MKGASGAMSRSLQAVSWSRLTSRVGRSRGGPKQWAELPAAVAEGVHMWVCLRVLTLTQDNLGFWSACTVQHSSPGVLLSLCLHSCNAVLARHAFGFMSTPVCAVACQHQWTAMQDDQRRVIC